MVKSKLEAAATTVVTLAGYAERRTVLVEDLSAAVTAIVAELDPDAARGRWQDLPRWARLDSLDRLRRGLGQLLQLEVQAQTVIDDLRAGLFTSAKPLTAERPYGLAPLAGCSRLQQTALVRAKILIDMAGAERALRTPVEAGLYGALRVGLRRLTAEEMAAAAAGVLLVDLLVASPEQAIPA